MDWVLFLMAAAAGALGAVVGMRLARVVRRRRQLRTALETSLTYQDLLEGHRPDPAQTESALGNFTLEQQANWALGLALLDLPDHAEIAISAAEANSPAGDVRAILLEARSIRAASLAESDKVVEGLAEGAVEANPTAVFGLRLLARIAEHRGQAQAAAGFYARAWQVYPESQRTLLDLVRVLIRLRQKVEARTYLGKAQLSFRREIYRLALGRRGVYGLALAVLVALLVLGDATVLPTMIVGVALGAFVLLYGLLRRDGVALSVGVWLEALTWIMFGVRLLFLRAN